MLQKCAGTLLSLCLFIVNVQAQQSVATEMSEFRVVIDPHQPTPGSRTSGLDIPHGQLYGLLGKGFPGEDSLAPTVRLPLINFGGAVGGIIRNHRNFYFLSSDREAFDWEKLLAGLPANASLLSAVGYPGPAVTTGQDLGRFDHSASERESFDLQYNRSHVTSKGLPGFADVLNFDQQSGTIDNAVAISPDTLNETRGQMTAVSVRLPEDAPAYGIQSGWPTARSFKIFEAADNISHQAANQELRGGASFLYDLMTVSFLEGGAGKPSFSQSSRSAGLYIQDQWKIGPQLVVTAGLRYDLQFLDVVRTDTGNLGPGVGFAWSPPGWKSTVLRGGYGIMYEQHLLPAFPALFHLGGDALGSFTPLNPSIRNAYAEHANLEFEHQFGQRSTFSAIYQHVRGLELAVPVKNSTGAWQYNSSAASFYDGLTVAFVQHPVNWGDYKIVYAYADGNASQGQNWDDVVADQMRRVSFTGALHTPLNTGSGIWDQITHRTALTGYGDFTRQNELPGVHFVHLHERLSKEIPIGRRFRLEMFVQKSGLLRPHRYAMGGDVTASYAGFAAVGSSPGMQVGLRIRF